MARLYADENFPQPAVERLRTLGHDVITVQDVGKARQKLPDIDVLTDAATDGRAVVTHNRKDFRYLHAMYPHHQGIIVCSEDLDFVGLADRIHAAVGDLPSLAGQWIRVTKPQHEPRRTRPT